VAIASLDNAMSYTMESYENGPYTVNLLKKHEKTGSYFFPSGLVSEAIEILTELGYEVVYSKGKQRPLPELDTLSWTGPTLWPHQKVAATDALYLLNNGLGAIIHLSTGSGKSMIGMWIINELKVKTLITTHSKELSKQWKEVIEKNLGITPTLVGAGKKEFGDITIATIQTLVRMLPKDNKTKSSLLNRFELLISDEIHRYAAPTYAKVAMNCNAYYRIGMSATPSRSTGDSKKFIGAIGQIIHPINTEDLIKNGILADPEFRFYVSPEPENWGKKTYADGYKHVIVLNQKRNELICKLAIDLANKGKFVYVHVTRIDHGKILEKKIKGAIFISGHDTDKLRDTTIEKYKREERGILISTLLGEAQDFKGLDVVIMASGGKSEIATIQRVGRALRTSSNKTTAIIIDFMDRGHWFRDHSQIRIETYKKVFGNKRIEDGMKWLKKNTQ
jgi:superfamily II DNA or RNA helicase